jgi:itaconate CoA-transferase
MAVISQHELTTDARFATQADRVAHRTELDARIEATLAVVDGAGLLRRLEEAGIAMARQRNLADVINHPQLLERERWVPVDTPAGQIQALRPPIEWTGMPARMGPVPAAGEHTAQVRAEIEHLGNEDQHTLA